MIHQVSLIIDGEPIAKARPRFSKYGHAYTPKKTAQYEKKIKDAYRTQPNTFKFERSAALMVSIIFSMPIPQSYSKKRRKWILDGYEHYTKKPDIDNLAKAVLDALNGVAWEDDSQIVTLNLRKEYSEHPSVWVSIRLADV